MPEATTQPGTERFIVLDLARYIPGRMFSEAVFRETLRRERWEEYRDRKVLVRACRTGPVPPWAFMLLLSHLVRYADSVLYGEECAPVTVFRRRLHLEGFQTAPDPAPQAAPD